MGSELRPAGSGLCRPGKIRAAISRILAIDAILKRVLLSSGSRVFRAAWGLEKMEKGQDCGMGDGPSSGATDRGASGAALRLLRREDRADLMRL
jgi:hypothetical protein